MFFTYKFISLLVMVTNTIVTRGRMMHQNKAMWHDITLPPTLPHTLITVCGSLIGRRMARGQLSRILSSEYAGASQAAAWQEANSPAYFSQSMREPHR